jgi:hypothetical protein
MIHDIILYLFVGVSYSFGIYQLREMLNNSNPIGMHLKPYTNVELTLLALFWPFFLIVFIISFFKS